MKAISIGARKAAKKRFPKLPHSTRAFSKVDYDALPSVPDRKPTN